MNVFQVTYKVKLANFPAPKFIFVISLFVSSSELLSIHLLSQSNHTVKEEPISWISSRSLASQSFPF